MKEIYEPELLPFEVFRIKDETLATMESIRKMLKVPEATFDFMAVSRRPDGLYRITHPYLHVKIAVRLESEDFVIKKIGINYRIAPIPNSAWETIAENSLRVIAKTTWGNANTTPDDEE